MENRFDLYDLPEGHEERFLEKMDQRLLRRQNRRIALRWTAAAAAAAAILLLVLPAGDRYFRGARTPEAVYNAYLQQIGTCYEQLARNYTVDAFAWEATLASLTQETIPLVDQLPDEMPDREKTRILKQYYGALLDGANRLKEEWNN